MTELEKMQRAKLYIDSLANGIDPLNESVIKDDGIVNNVRMSRCFFYVSDILRQVIENGGTVSKKGQKKLPFHIEYSQLLKFEFSNIPISVSEITRRINDLVDENKMKKFSYSQITNWLILIEMLEEITDENGKKVKQPAAIAMEYGITIEKRHSQYGEYKVVLYDEVAQHFIIDNFEAILENSI